MHVTQTRAGTLCITNAHMDAHERIHREIYAAHDARSKKSLARSTLLLQGRMSAHAAAKQPPCPVARLESEESHQDECTCSCKPPDSNII